MLRRSSGRKVCAVKTKERKRITWLDNTRRMVDGRRLVELMLRLVHSEERIAIYFTTLQTITQNYKLKTEI